MKEGQLIGHEGLACVAPLMCVSMVKVERKQDIVN
jgi:hypothetical protein